jgi:ribosomal protein S6
MEEKVLTKISYEFFLVLSAKLGEDSIEAMIKRFEDLISQHGEIESIDRWGRRKFAYPIKKESEGEYVLFNFKSEAKFPMELDRISRITDGVLRSLIVKKDPKSEEIRKNEENAENA